MKRSFDAVGEYRFNVGEEVLCNTGKGRNGWEPGEIVMMDYQLPGDTTTHPYQVKLHCGRLIYIPWDDDTCCKRHSAAWWEQIMQYNISDHEGVQMLRECSKEQDINAKNHEGDAVLHSALFWEWIPGVKEVLSLRADPNLDGYKHSRPLNLAVSLGIDVVKLLLNARADPCCQDEDPEKDPDYRSVTFQEREWHRSSLHYAVGSSLEITELLLGKRADINQLDAQCKQPLHLAIEGQVPGIVDLLLQSEADVNTGNISIGMTSTPLFDAVYRKDAELIKKLLAVRSDVNRQGKQGMTVLHMACRSRQSDIARLILTAKSDINIKAAGKTAAQLALRNGLTELATILEPHRGATHEGPSRQQDVMRDAKLRKELYLE